MPRRLKLGFFLVGCMSMAGLFALAGSIKEGRLAGAGGTAVIGSGSGVNNPVPTTLFGIDMASPKTSDGAVDLSFPESPISPELEKRALSDKLPEAGPGKSAETESAAPENSENAPDSQVQNPTDSGDAPSSVKMKVPPIYGESEKPLADPATGPPGEGNRSEREAFSGNRKFDLEGLGRRADIPGGLSDRVVAPGELADSKLPLPGLSLELRKMVALAMQARSASESLELYRAAVKRAAQIYRYNSSEAEHAIQEMRKNAAFHIRPKIALLVADAYEAASRVSPSDPGPGEAAKRAVSTLEHWDEFMGSGYILDLSQVQGDISETLGRAKTDQDFPISRPKVLVAPTPKSNRFGIVNVRIIVKKAPMQEDVLSVPKDLRQSYDIKSFPQGPTLSSIATQESFLSPPAYVGFFGSLRAGRGFGTSLRDWAGGEGHYIKDWLGRLLDWARGLLGSSGGAGLAETRIRPNIDLDREWQQSEPRSDSGDILRIAYSEPPQDTGAKAQAAAMANMVLGVGRSDGSFLKAQALNLSDRPWRREDGSIISRGLRAMIRSLRKADIVPKASWIFKDDRAWAVLRLGSDEARLFGNFAPVSQDGMVRVRYEQKGLNPLGGPMREARLYYLARILEGLGFSGRVRNGVLEASIDKNLAARGPEDLLDAFSSAFEAFRSSEHLGPLFDEALQGWPTIEENGRRLARLAEIFLAEEGLPFYSSAKPETIAPGLKPYLGQESRSSLEKLLIDFNGKLRRLGLSEGIPADAPMGRATMERFYERELDAALARGEIFETEKGARRDNAPGAAREVVLLARGEFARTPGYDPVRMLAAAVAGHPEEAAAIAPLADRLASELLLRFKTVGEAGPWVVQTAQGRVDSSLWLTLRVLRDPADGRIAWAQADAWEKRGGAPGRMRPLADAGALRRFMVEIGLPGSAETSAGSENISRERPNARAFLTAARRRLPQWNAELARTAWGRALGAAPKAPARRPGLPVRGKVFYGGVPPDPAAGPREDYIFVTPFVARNKLDEEAVRGAKAVLVTHGDSDSYAVQLAGQFGVPVFVLREADWTDFGLRIPESVLGPLQRGPGGLEIREAQSSRSVVLRPGDELRLEPTGAIRLPAGR